MDFYSNSYYIHIYVGISFGYKHFSLVLWES